MRIMSPEIMKGYVPKLSIESVERLSTGDLHELCDAAEAAIMSGGGPRLAVGEHLSWRITGAVF